MIHESRKSSHATTSGFGLKWIPEFHRLMTLYLHRLATSGLRKFKIPDIHRFATSGLRRFEIPDLHRFNLPENLFHEFRQTRRFEGDKFFLNSPTHVRKSYPYEHLRMTEHRQIWRFPKSPMASDSRSHQWHLFFFNFF
jgi:hypothetical protein